MSQRILWVCLECGRSDWPGVQPVDWTPGTQIHIRQDKKGNCEAMPVKGTWHQDPVYRIVSVTSGTGQSS